MYHFIKKNQKKMLAVFGVGLMIVFILPPAMSNYNSVSVVGTAGEEEISGNELAAAAEEWDFLQREVWAIQELPGGIPGLSQNDVAPIVFMLGTEAIEQINQHPEMYLLLQKEARRMGVQVSDDRLETILVNQVRVPQLAGADQPNQNRLAAFSELADARLQNKIRQAIKNFLLVENAYEQASSVIKVTQPMRRRELSGLQNIRVNLVEFSAAAMADQVPPPTDQQLQEYFDQYAAIDSEQADPKTNPLGFGYRIPNKVKLQYIKISRDDLRKLVESGKNEYDWEVAARRYYKENLQQFPSTQPAEPTTSPFSTGMLGPVGWDTPARPTTRPFDEVHDEIKNRLVRPEVDQLLEKILFRISTTMAEDWRAYQYSAVGGQGQNPVNGNSAPPATQPTTRPSTAYGVPFDDYEYLKRLAADIQRRFNYLPTVEKIENDFKSAGELATEYPELAAARAGATGLPTYATTSAKAFAPADQQENPALLALFQPSPPLNNNMDDIYIFRLSDVKPSEKADDLNKVRETVAQDYRDKVAYEMALEQAKSLLDAAAGGRLGPAAENAQRKVIATGPFRLGGDISGYELSDQAQAKFAAESFKMLGGDATSKSDHPITLIELPRERKVLVAELAEWKPVWDAGSYTYFASRAGQQLDQELEQDFRKRWFDFESVTSRLDYQPRGR